MLKTVITTLQGGAAAYSLVGSFLGLPNVGFITLMGLDMVFYPLAILGLLRLCAAAWLTEDFAYGLLHDYGGRTPTQDFHVPKFDESTIRMEDNPRGPRLVAHSPLDLRFTPPGSSWPSRIFRGGFLLLCGAVWFLAFIFFISPLILNGFQDAGELWFTVTSLVVAIFYLFFFTMTLVIFAWYSLLGQTTSTIVPCISHPWYKIYTLVVMGLTVVMIVVACIETNRGANGMYTSQPMPLNYRCYDWRQ
jgi:MFS family permease